MRKIVNEVEMVGSEASLSDKERKEKNIKRYEGMIKDAEEKLKKLEKDKEAAKEKLKGKGEKFIAIIEDAEKKKHDVHHDEEQLTDKFEEWFGSTHLRITVLTKQIKEKKLAIDAAIDGRKAKNESSLHTFQDFLLESKIDEDDNFANLLKTVYENELSSIRKRRINEEFDTWVREKVGYELDEEYTKHYENAQNLLYTYLYETDDTVNENNVNEGRASLEPKLSKIFGEIAAKHGPGFSNATLGRWNFWSYDQEMPQEVIDAAKKLGASHDKIEYFTTEDDPDAFEDFAKSLQNSDLDYEFGTFKTNRGRPLNFAIVINK